MGSTGIHPQLLADCHYLGGLPACDVLLNRNAAVPWFILVPDTKLPDVLDLPEAQSRAVVCECATISAFIKGELGYCKVNFAGLGNVVPQMHLHIIGRSNSDACWPLPVWGALPEGEEYQAAVLQEWQDKLVGFAGLTPAVMEVVNRDI
ncbi:MAG: HIT domain-containing protein [Proteobacteria bacterium]|nr:HIT domain-containing protein [Pseudomonadota bacterium]